jgi:transposase
MKAYCIGHRVRVLEDCDGGMPEVAAAAKWKVSGQWIPKIKKQRCETGSLEPIKPKTGPKPKLREHRELLQQIVTKTPDAALEEIRTPLSVQVTLPTIHKELKKLKLVYKKNNSMPAGKSGRTLPKPDRNGKCE